MARLQPIDPADAPGKANALLDAVQKSHGKAPNLLRTLAHSPAALEGYLSFSKALSGGRLDARLRESIALAVAGETGCDYCASAHTAIGRSLGLSEDELAHNLRGRSDNPHTAAALRFVKAVIAKRGFVSDEDLLRVRDAGFSDGDIAEMVGAVALNMFTNYFNHVAGTEIDFPLVPADSRKAA